METSHMLPHPNPSFFIWKSQRGLASRAEPSFSLSVRLNQSQGVNGPVRRRAGHLKTEVVPLKTCCPQFFPLTHTSHLIPSPTPTTSPSQLSHACRPHHEDDGRIICINHLCAHHVARSAAPDLPPQPATNPLESSEKTAIFSGLDGFLGPSVVLAAGGPPAQPLCHHHHSLQWPRPRPARPRPRPAVHQAALHTALPWLSPRLFNDISSQLRLPTLSHRVLRDSPSPSPPPSPPILPPQTWLPPRGSFPVNSMAAPSLGLWSAPSPGPSSFSSA